MDSLKGINVDQFLAFLESLQAMGVQEFEGFGFALRFADTCFAKERIAASTPAAPVVVEEPPKRAPAMNLWDNEHLWPGGKPPRFPGSEE